MHSVVVLGDVRTHLVDLEQDPEWENSKTPDVRVPTKAESFGFYGGAVFMKDAVRIALEQKKRLRTNLRSKEGIALFGYRTARADTTTYTPIGCVLKWFLKPYAIEEDQKPRPRLKFRDITANKQKAVADEVLIKCLTGKTPKSRRFEHPNPKGLPDTRECPDIVIFDDLGEGLRSVRFELLGKTQVKDTEERLAKANLDSVEIDELEKQNRDLYALLFHRFGVAREESEAQRFPLLEPIIIGSIKTSPQKVLSQRLEERKERTVWEHIFADDWLRERTCLLLDAADLRDSGFAISSGLSWERTAQDTISEFWKHSELRPLLEFSQVIVRYGVTGALHIVRRSSRVWTYRLFFDPAHDDMAWAVEDRDGSVLGVTSVYVATLVQELDLHCRDLDEHPFLGQYSTTVAKALPKAISRSRHLNDVAYGAQGWSTFRSRFDPSRSRPQWLPEDVFSDPYGHHTPEFGLKPNAVSSSSVPPMVLASWSIVGQAAQGRYGEVAREIVMYGPDRVLNQPVVSWKELSQNLAEAVINNFKDEVGRNGNDAPVPRTTNKLEGLDWSRIYDRTFDYMQELTHLFGNRSASQVTAMVRGLDANWDPVGQAVIRKAPKSLDADAFGSLVEMLKENPKLFQDIISLPEPADVPADTLAAPLVAFPATTITNSDSWSLYIVDRREIEGYRAIRRLMRRHIDNVQTGTSDRPLCIAVFGPPGSGKSISVRKINESLPNTNTKVLDPFNVAQFEGLGNLEEAFDRILNASKGTTVPIAFFDEFDTNFGDNLEPLGWLKYFLAPMEDGEFLGKSVRNAILVFAGGTSRNFSEFSLANRDRTDDQWIAFSKAKGPDFTSRLLGHLDIVGINPAGGDDELYMIRRAILIRALLTKIQRLHSGDVAKINPDMLYAFLHVPEYRHGGRSVRMLLELCRSADEHITPSAVPPLHQLNMLVDGKAFMDLLSRFHAA